MQLNGGFAARQMGHAYCLVIVVRDVPSPSHERLPDPEILLPSSEKVLTLPADVTHPLDQLTLRADF